MKQSTKRLLSVFMCVTVLTSTAFVSGCSLSRTVGKISSAAEKASGSQVENFNKLIDAENNYIDFRLSFGGKEKQFNDGLRNGVYDQSFVAANAFCLSIPICAKVILTDSSALPLSSACPTS